MKCKPRHELDTLLDKLAAAIPEMVADHQDIDSFWPVFAGAADIIEDAAAPEDHDYVRGRIDAMLAANCLVPDDG